MVLTLIKKILIGRTKILFAFIYKQSVLINNVCYISITTTITIVYFVECVFKSVLTRGKPGKRSQYGPKDEFTRLLIKIKETKL